MQHWMKNLCLSLFIRTPWDNPKWWLFPIWKTFLFHYSMDFSVHPTNLVRWSTGKAMQIDRSIRSCAVASFSLLDQIPQTFANSQETETILAPVIQAGIQALKVRKGDRWNERTMFLFDSSGGKLYGKDLHLLHDITHCRCTGKISESRW